MDFSRCVVVNVNEYVWELILPYMFKKKERYHWIIINKNELYKPNTDIIHAHIPNIFKTFRIIIREKRAVLNQ